MSGWGSDAFATTWGSSLPEEPPPGATTEVTLANTTVEKVTVTRSTVQRATTGARGDQGRQR